MIETIWIPGEVRLAADVAGIPGAPLLLFLHGVGGWRGNWRPQLDNFADRWRCVALDARGYGDSEDNPGNTLAFETLTDDVARAIRHLGGGPAVIVGLSMGGRIALDLFRRHRSQVRALVLADTSAGAPPDDARREAFLALRRKPLIEEGKTPADLAPAIVASIAGPYITAEARALLIDSHARLRTRSYLQTLDAVTRFGDFPPWASIDVPTLVVTGEYDPIATPEYAREIAKQIPGAQIEVAGGVGHVSNVEEPELFDFCIVDFLDGLE